MKRILLLLALLALSGAAHAGTGFYISFINHQNYPVQISLVSSYRWWVDEFWRPVYVRADGTSTVFYTESKGEAGIIRLDVSGGKYQGERLEMWQDGYGHEVQQNVHEFTLDASAGWHDLAHSFGIGTSGPDIATAINARPDGSYGTVHAVVVLD